MLISLLVVLAAAPAALACGGRLSGDSGAFTSPNHPNNYPSNADCTWTLTFDEPTLVIFTAFVLEGASSGRPCRDYVEVWDGEKSLGRFCGRQIPGPFLGTSGSMRFQFISDYSLEYAGFRAIYNKGTDRPDGLCGTDMTAAADTFTSPNYPDKYPNNGFCIWTIKVDEGKYPTLVFEDFEFEGTGTTTCRDYVSVWDGTTDLGTYCGKTAPKAITGAGNFMTVVFASDESLQYRGFKAYYTSGDEPRPTDPPPPPACGDDFRGVNGTFGTPNYPGLYPPNHKCSTTIYPGEGQYVRLEFEDFVLQPPLSNGACQADTVIIYDGDTLTGYYCGTNMPPVLESKNDRVTVYFESNSSLNYKGFLANFWVIDADQEQNLQ